MVYIHFGRNSKTSTQRHCKWLEASHQKLQGAIEVQTVQGAMKVVKRLETWVEAVAFTLCRGWSVGGNTERGDRFSSGLRCITSRCTGTEVHAIICDAK
jgi:hypothetical protein